MLCIGINEILFLNLEEEPDTTKSSYNTECHPFFPRRNKARTIKRKQLSDFTEFIITATRGLDLK